MSRGQAIALPKHITIMLNLYNSAVELTADNLSQRLQYLLLLNPPYYDAQIVKRWFSEKPFPVKGAPRTYLSFPLRVTGHWLPLIFDFRHLPMPDIWCCFACANVSYWERMMTVVAPALFVAIFFAPSYSWSWPRFHRMQNMLFTS